LDVRKAQRDRRTIPSSVPIPRPDFWRKRIEGEKHPWDIPIAWTKVDDRRRIVLPEPATPGEIYHVGMVAKGRYLVEKMAIETQTKPLMSFEQFKDLVESSKTKMKMSWAELRQATREL
jgi:hypothetical protein